MVVSLQFTSSCSFTHLGPGDVDGTPRHEHHDERHAVGNCRLHLLQQLQLHPRQREHVAVVTLSGGGSTYSNTYSDVS